MIRQLGPLTFFVTCTHYCEHRMNNFHMLLKATNMFGKKKQFIEFQTCGLPCDHGLLWIDAPHFGVSSNEVIEKFVNKYLTMDEIIHKRKYS